MAMTFAAYAAPPGWERPVAIAAVVLLVAVNYRGISRTAALARIIVVAVLLALAIAVSAAWTGGPAPSAFPGEGLLSHGWYGILQSAGLLFFAFAGYARIATLGEEVRDPRRTIARAILLSLAIAAAIYAVVAVTLLAVLGPDGVAATRCSPRRRRGLGSVDLGRPCGPGWRGAGLSGRAAGSGGGAGQDHSCHGT